MRKLRFNICWCWYDGKCLTACFLEEKTKPWFWCADHCSMDTPRPISSHQPAVTECGVGRGGSVSCLQHSPANGQLTEEPELEPRGVWSWALAHNHCYTVNNYTRSLTFERETPQDLCEVLVLQGPIKLPRLISSTSLYLFVLITNRNSWFSLEGHEKKPFYLEVIIHSQK